MRKLGSFVAAAVAVAVLGVGGVGSAGATNIGEEGCTPGYWKNHTENWQEYRPDSLLRFNFTIPSSLASFQNKTFLEVLQGGGGPGLEGAATILFRASIAAFLNAAHEGVGFPLRRFDEPGEMQAAINAALATGDRQTMLDLAAELDALNNLGCPL